MHLKPVENDLDRAFEQNADDLNHRICSISLLSHRFCRKPVPTFRRDALGPSRVAARNQPPAGSQCANGPATAPRRRSSALVLALCLPMLTMLTLLPMHAYAQSAAPEAASAQSDVADYRLGAGDQLRITVFDEPSLTGSFVISPQGTVSFPLIGEVEAHQLTSREFSEALLKQLRQFIREPRVAVEISQYRPFYILGEVQKPGAYPYAAGLTAQKAVALAGGYTYRAQTLRIFLKRESAQNETPQWLKAPLSIYPGDTLRVGERLF